MSIKVISVCHDKTHAATLIYSLEKNGWSHHIIETEWRGFSTKIIETYQYLKEHPEVTEFIFCDAFDVVALGTPEEFEAKLDGYSGMIFSAERGCWPDGSLAGEYEHFEHGFNYLNSGLYYSNSKWFLNLVEHNMPRYGDDDQLYFTKFYLDAPDPQLDDECKFFQSYSFIRDEDYQYTLDNRLYNNWTKEFPIFVHGNGRSDMTKILELI